MKNQFEAIYAKETEIKARYQAAKVTNDELGMEQARTDHRALTAQIESAGKLYAMLYTLYEQAMNVGNTFIDLSECHQYQNEAELITGLREYGITAFTFSSGWSSAVESAWAFTQNGCTLQGMVQINSQHKVFMSDEYEKRAAFLFRVEGV